MPNPSKIPPLPLIIIGAGGHASSVANVARSAGYALQHFVDSDKAGGELFGVSIIPSIETLKNLQDYSFCIAVGGNSVREDIYHQLSRICALSYPTLIHSSAAVSEFASLGEGTVVMPQAVVGPNSQIGKFCIINTHSSIDHDCTLSDFASLAPGAITGGTVKIGNRSAISMGALIKHGIQIGNDSVIGANSYVNKDIPSNQVVYGSPAKVIRARDGSDPYL